MCCGALEKQTHRLDSREVPHKPCVDDDLVWKGRIILGGSRLITWQQFPFVAESGKRCAWVGHDIYCHPYNRKNLGPDSFGLKLLVLQERLKYHRVAPHRKEAYRSSVSVEVLIV